MTSLIMDTSHQYLVVALYEDGQCLESIQEFGLQKQSENAIPYLEKLLKKYHKELLDIDEMIITKGPGSYTGQRVAMTIAKTLSVISPIKIKAISSLLAYAGMERCIAVIDARSHKLFVGVYDQGQVILEDQLIDQHDFQSLRQRYSDYQVVGQCELVGEQATQVDLAKNMYQVSKLYPEVENVDCLVPTYLKDVEAKKICK